MTSTISIIITATDEDLTAQTIKSIRRTTKDVEVVLVDDASSDHRCDHAGADIVVRHEERVGIANSRLDGAEAASGDCLVFMDAHHLFEPGCIEGMATTAAEYGVIAWPYIGGIGTDDHNRSSRGYGGYLSPSEDKGKEGLIGNHWIKTKQPFALCRASALFVPYAIPRSLFHYVRWPRLMQGYGAHEPAVAVRAFFCEVDIVHNRDWQSSHLFRDSSPFPRPARNWWRNHALTARICFTDATWRQYWAPVVFGPAIQKRRISMEEFDTSAVVQAHQAFQRLKRRPDSFFWRGLYHQQPPEGVTDDT